MKNDLDSTNKLLNETIRVRIDEVNCMHDKVDSHSEIPHIFCYTATIHLPEQLTIGSIKGQLLRKAEMDNISPNTMWEECQAFDASHAAESKLDKVENYLANECFPPDKQALIDEAESILFVQEVHIHRKFRGQGISLFGIDLLVKQLGVEENCVVLLQAAPLANKVSKDEEAEVCALIAHEKIARHWKRTGFQEWSWTDDAWLCLSTGKQNRPKIEDVVPNLFIGQDKIVSLDIKDWTVSY